MLPSLCCRDEEPDLSMTSRVRRLLRLIWGSPSDWHLHKPARPVMPVPSLSWLGPTALIAAAAAGWWAFTDTVGEEANAGLALFVGSVAIVAMTWSNLLSTRWRVLEPFFGGLDRMYRWHRWFGVAAVGAMWLHIQLVDDVKGVPGASKSVADAAEDLAGVAEKLLYVLVVVSLLRWIPYRWWRLTHKALVIPYGMACWHFYTATKPFGNGEAWGRWFSAVMVLGLASWAYRVVWRDIIRRGVPYAVHSVEHQGSLTHLVLAPPSGRAAGARGRHRAGQFVFLAPQVRGLAEPHPFTVASCDDDGRLHFHIRDLGDWTDRLASRLSVGDTVRVEGPYGRLRANPRQPRGQVVWIAGGVGVTPFVAAAQSSRPASDGSVPHLFWAVRSRSDAPAYEVLSEAADQGRLHLHLFAGDEDRRLSPDDLDAVFGSTGLAAAHVVMCGPMSLVTSMTTAVRRLGARRVHVEHFDIRGGFGPDLSRVLDYRRP